MKAPLPVFPMALLEGNGLCRPSHREGLEEPLEEPGLFKVRPV
jgi:hypothetical protein